MEKVIYNKFDKKGIATLPRAVFGGRIFVITTADEAEKAVRYLLSQKILGVDTETKPSFKKGKTYEVALLQVSTHDTCFLFRLNLIGMTPAIIRLLEDVSVPKIGLSLHDDIMSLHKRADFVPGNFIDLQKRVCELGVEDLSLQKLYANFFHEKSARTCASVIGNPTCLAKARSCMPPPTHGLASIFTRNCSGLRKPVITGW